ncbi:MAG TPA: hypothetical protein DCP91_03830 [Eggerthellaceae bacterium]|nr:hypothetical protein [Eggerthellaceae bacterium]
MGTSRRGIIPFFLAALLIVAGITLASVAIAIGEPAKSELPVATDDVLLSANGQIKEQDVGAADASGAAKTANAAGKGAGSSKADSASGNDAARGNTAPASNAQAEPAEATGGANQSNAAPVGNAANRQDTDAASAAGASANANGSTSTNANADASTATSGASASADENAQNASKATDADKSEAAAVGSLAGQAGPSARTRLGNVNARFTIYPGGEEGGNLSGNNLSIVPTKDKAYSVTVQLDLSTSGSEPANPGELEVLVPRSIFQTHSGGQTKIDIPYPASGTGDWTYTFVKEDGTQAGKDSSDCKYVKLVNRIPIDPAHTQTMAFAYSVEYASYIKDGSNVDFQPIVTLTKKDGTERNDKVKLNVKVDTQVEIANAAKSTYNSFVTDRWQSAWGPEPSLPGGNDQYFFLMWELSAYLKWDSATQPYILTYKEPDTVPDGGIVCGYMDWYDNNTGSGKRNESESTKPLLSEPPKKTVMVPNKDVSSWFSGVLVAYKKPTSTPKEYKNTFTAEIKPYDGKDQPTTHTDEGTFTYKDLALNIPSGEMYYLEKIKGWIANDAYYRRAHGAIDRLKAGVPVDNIAYSISGYAYQYTKDANDTSKIKSWGAEYTSELIDDMLFLNVNPDCRLGAGDYEITRINPQWEAYEYHMNMAVGGYEEVEVDYKDPSVEYPDLVAWGRNSDTAPWVQLATFQINSDGRAEVKSLDHGATSYYNAETHRQGVNIAKGTGITQVKYSITANKGKATEDNKGVIRVRFERRSSPGGAFHSWDSTNKSELYLTLYPTEKVKAEVQKAVDENVKSDPAPAGGHSKDGDGGEGDGYAPVAKLHNIDMIAVYVGKDSQGKLDKQKGAFVAGEFDANFKDVLFQHDKTIFGGNIQSNNTMWHKKAQVELTPYEYDSAIKKSSTYENDPGNQRVIVHYTSSAAEAAITHDTDVPQELIDYGIIRLQQTGTFYDLLPQGMTVDLNSIAATASADDAPVDVEYETIANYKDSGRTLLVVKVATDVPNWKRANSWPNGISIANRGSTTLNHIESGFTITYNGYYDWDSLADYGNEIVNYIAYESDNDRIENGVDDDASKWEYTDFTPVVDYFKNLDPAEPEYDQDGKPIETPNFLYTNDTNTLNVVTQARYGLTKNITGPTVAGWVHGRVGEGEANQVGVPAGEQYQYRLRYAAEPGTTVKNMVLFDGLEAYEYIRDKAAGGTGEDAGSSKSDEIDIDRDGYQVVTWRGTFESIDTSGIEALGAKADVYYTTKNREELQVDDQSTKSDTLDGEGKLAECWQGPLTASQLNALEDEQKAGITGIAIDMRKKKNGQEFELASEKSVAAIVTMRAPSDPAAVRSLVDSAKEQYEAADADAKAITNDKPYTYNAVNMNAQVKEKGAGSYSNEHLITYEYTRAYLYIPKGNISIEKRVTGLPEQDAADYEFQVTAEQDGAPFAGQYRRIHTASGNYYTNVEGVFVNASSGNAHFVTYDAEAAAWVSCDAQGNPTASDVAAVEADYTFESVEADAESAPSYYTIKDGQRIVLLDVDGDLEWKVTELDANTEGMETTHTLNGKAGASPRTTEPFVTGDKNTARIVFTNAASSELVIEKNVAVGDDDKPFAFTVKFFDENDEEPYDDLDKTVPSRFTCVIERSDDSADAEGEGEDEGEGAATDAPAANEPIATFDLASGETVTLTHGQRARIALQGIARYEIVEEQLPNYEPPSIQRTVTTRETDPETGEVVPVETTEESNGAGDLHFMGSVKETFTNTHVPDEGPSKIVEGNDVDNDKIEPIDEPVADEDATATSTADKTNSEKTHVDLGAYANPFTYTITQGEVPIETKKMVLSDTLEDVLEFVSSADDIVLLDAEGKNVADNEDIVVNTTIEGQTLTVSVEFADPNITDDEGNVIGVKNYLIEYLKAPLSVSFDAKVRDDADLAPYVVQAEEGGEASIVIPNTAKVAFNNRPEVESERVTVTPPPPDEEISKLVQGAEHYDLPTPHATYEYTIDAVVPVDADKLVVSDTLEDVLEFVSTAEDVAVTFGDAPVEGAVAAIDGQTLTVTLEGDAAKAQRTRTITVSFEARIRDGADLTKYATTGSVLVPNTASYEINNNPERVHESNPVTVTPPPEEPGIDKRVDRVSHVDLKTANQNFTYTLSMYVPAEANTFGVTDTLEPVLEFVDDASKVKVARDDGTAIAEAEATIADKTLTVEFGEDIVPGLRTQFVTISFKARVVDGADLSDYTDNTVPNKASYKINNDATYESDTVTVKPPTEPVLPEPNDPDDPNDPNDPDSPTPEPVNKTDKPNPPTPGTNKPNPPADGRSTPKTGDLLQFGFIAIAAAVALAVGMESSRRSRSAKAGRHAKTK